MSDSPETAPKVHYICQTYIEKKGKQATLQVDKLFQYSSASQAQERAAREFNSDKCVGADAYMVVEDPSSGEVGPPEFLERHGSTPEIYD